MLTPGVVLEQLQSDINPKYRMLRPQQLVSYFASPTNRAVGLEHVVLSIMSRTDHLGSIAGSPLSIACPGAAMTSGQLLVFLHGPIVQE